MQEEHYERLPGGHLGFLSRDSLWLGSDHILLVKDLGYLERYQRYYFRDIQGLTLEPTPRYVRIAVGVGIFALPAVLVVLGAVAGIVPDGLGIAAAAIGFLPFVVWVTHVLRGPTCTTTVHTAVGDAALTALGRQRPARRRRLKFCMFLVPI